MSKILKSRVEKRGDEYHVYNVGVLMNKINQMSTGACFGELALMSNRDTELRAATVLCTEDTEFAVLDRQSFLVKLLLTVGYYGRN